MATPLSWSRAAHHHNKPTATALAPCSSEKKRNIMVKSSKELSTPVKNHAAY